MKRETISQLERSRPVGQTVLVAGWIRSVRKSKKFAFLSINDGSNFAGIQAVVDAELSNWEELRSLGTGSSVKIAGVLVESQGKGQDLEIQASSVEVVSATPEDYPLQKKATSLEFLREQAHLRARTNTFNAVFRVRHLLSLATHEFFDANDFTYLHAPIITASDCEGAGDLFRVSTLNLQDVPMKSGQVDYARDYFGKESFLNVSGQLEAESHALALGRVYTFGPTFRSENSNTSRHLAEFWMIEPEIAFADLEDNIDLAKNYLQFLFKTVLKRASTELEFLEERYEKGLKDKLSAVAEAPFEVISYTEAIDILQKAKKQGLAQFEYPPEWGADLQTEHERFLSEKHIQGPVVVRDYPKEIKAFYMKLNADGKTVAAMDVLVPGVGEIIGGSQREDSLEVLEQRMKAHGIDAEQYRWYLDLRRYGSTPHAGFGLGLERALMYATGMSNIRDVIAFPRYPGHVEF